MIHERQTCDELRMQMDEMLNREDRNMEDIDSLRVHIEVKLDNDIDILDIFCQYIDRGKFVLNLGC